MVTSFNMFKNVNCVLKKCCSNGLFDNIRRMLSQSVVCSYNDWDPLQEVILGRPEGARVPRLTPDVMGGLRPAVYKWLKNHEAAGFPQDTIDKAITEVNEFERILKAEGVIVRRPEVIDYGKLGDFKTPDFEEGGLFATCPRDSLLVVGNEIIETSMSRRCRYFETRPFKRLLNEYFDGGAKWTCAPKATMTNELYRQDYPFTDEAKRSELTKQGIFVVTEFEPCMDAADVMRCGTHIFAQLSHSTNRKGVKWLQRHLGPTYHVQPVICHDNYAEHIDCTMVILRPGLLLVNPERPCYQIDFFTSAGWEVIEAPPPTKVDGKLSIYSSDWLSMNVLSLDEERVVVPSKELDLHRLLERYGLTTIKVDMYNASSLGGGFHCWTSDIRRKGTLQNYFT